MRLALAGVVAVALWAAAVADPSVAQPAEPSAELVGVQLVPHQDQADQGLRGLTSIVADVEAGQIVQRQVVVSNDTRSTMAIDVYVDGAAVDGDGFQPDDTVMDVALWSRVAPPQVVLSPGERRRVEVEIDVPREARNGEHFAVAWVQPPSSTGDVRQINRVGVRIYLSVTGGTGVADVGAADFVIDSLTAGRLADRRPQVRSAVRNTGTRVVDLVGTLTLTEGPGGTSAGPFATDAVVTLGAGRSAELFVSLPGDLPAGPWLARLELESGAVVRAAEGVIMFPDASDTTSAPVPVETSEVERQRRVLIPIASSLLLTLGVMLLVLWWGWRRARREAAAAGVARRDGMQSEPEGLKTDTHP